MTKLTKLEIQGIQGILTSEYDTDNIVGRCVWTWSANTFDSPKTFSGVVSSLVKKGLVKAEDLGDDATLCLLQAGWDALKEAAPEWCAELEEKGYMDHPKRR